MHDAARQPDPAPYPPAEPPATLYHAVSADRVARVLAEGLAPTGKPHVHLSRRADHAGNAIREELAPVVLVVDAAGMHAAGHAFYASPKGTWLTWQVPPQFLRRGESE